MPLLILIIPIFLFSMENMPQSLFLFLIDHLK